MVGGGGGGGGLLIKLRNNIVYEPTRDFKKALCSIFLKLTSNYKDVRSQIIMMTITKLNCSE